MLVFFFIGIPDCFGFYLVLVIWRHLLEVLRKQCIWSMDIY